jgi:hypothetical protein
MPRIPINRLRRRRGAPYVYRSAAHKALRESVELSKSAVVVGAESQVGVSRTLLEVIEELGEMRFQDGLDRHAVVLDLFSNAHLTLAEIMARLRNELVKTVDATLRLPDIESYFFDFDVAWAIWKQFEYGEQRHEIEIYQSRFRKLVGDMAKKVFAISTVGLFDAWHILEGAVEVIGGAAAEVGTERWAEVQGQRAGAYFMTKIAPKLNQRVWSAVDFDNCTADDVALQMLPIMIKAIDDVAVRVRRRTRLSIAIDAIDEIEGFQDDLVRVRAAICQILYEAASLEFSTILAGRAPAELWFAELAETPYENLDPLGLLSRSEIVISWSPHVEPAMLSTIVDEACGDQCVTTAGRLSEAWGTRTRFAARSVQ